MTAPRKVTLSDVASRAGVSATTASYILNNRTAEMRISADAAERVRRAAIELAYRPNRSARSLRTAKTKTIGLISDSVASGQFSSQMLTGASAASRDCDHLLVIGETEGDAMLEDQLIDEMLDRQVDGIVYATLVATNVSVPARLHDHRAPSDRGSKQPAGIGAPNEHTARIKPRGRSVIVHNSPAIPVNSPEPEVS